ncbi:MAG: hypothetical protein LJF15_12365 [Acidobacteria bacterium]|nr:hypothetical protein [Acidobacteriota bacterium]
MMSRRGLVGLVLMLVLLSGGIGIGQDQPAIVSSLTLFAGTAEGLFRSGDWGRSWERVRGTPAGVRLDALGAARVIVPLGPQVYVAGDGGLYVSNDFGVSWNAVSLTTGISSLLLSRWPQADPTVFAGTDSGLLRSRDGGRTFGPTALTTGPVHRLEWPGPALVVAGGGGLLVTTDEGETFADPGSGLPEGEVLAMALSSFFAVDPVLFAAPASGGVYRSGDGGRTWATTGLQDQVVGDLVWLGPFLYAAADGGFFRSSDSGASWTRLCDSPGRPAELMFPLAPAAGLEAFLATDRGVFRTADAGQTWVASGFQGQNVLTVATFPPPRPDLDVGRRR